MGLVADTAICTVAQAVQRSHEALITNLDDSSDVNATFQNALNESTNELIRRCRNKGVNDPSTVSAASVTDMITFAAFWALYSVFASMPQDDDNNRLKAESYKKRAEEQWLLLVITTTSDQDIATVQDKGLPRSVNMDSSAFFGPTDNRRRGSTPISGWTTK